MLNNFQTFRLYPFLNQQNQLSTLLSLPDNIVSGGYTFQRLRNRLILSFPLFFSTPAVRHSLNAALYSSMSFQFGAENLDKIIRDNIDTSRFTTLVPAGKFNFNPGIFLEYVAAGPKQSSTFTLDYSFLPSIFSYYNQVEHSFFLDSRFTFDGFGLYDRFSANIYYEKPNSFTGRRKSLAGNTRLRASIFDSFGVHFRYSTPIVFPNFGIPTLAFIRDIQLNPLIEYNLVRHQNINEVDDIFSVGAEIATDVSFFNLFSADLVFTLYYNILLAEQGIYNENQRISFNFNFRLALSSNHRHL